VSATPFESDDFPTNLDDHEDLEGVAHILADDLRGSQDYPGVLVESLPLRHGGSARAG
jgi:hypothetical protein